jgi:hypothetical protein
MWLREFHRLLVKIAVKHSVNFATAKHDSGIPRPEHK